jgi:uncharacterized membrane protein (DUF106 family)
LAIEVGVVYQKLPRDYTGNIKRLEKLEKELSKVQEELRTANAAKNNKANAVRKTQNDKLTQMENDVAMANVNITTAYSKGKAGGVGTVGQVSEGSEDTRTGFGHKNY